MTTPSPGSTPLPGDSKPTPSPGVASSNPAPVQMNTPTMSTKKFTKLKVAAMLQGKNEWASFKGMVTQWVKANKVAKHLEEEETKRGIPADADKKEEWEQEDAMIFGAIEAKLSAEIQATISSTENTAKCGIDSSQHMM